MVDYGEELQISGIWIIGLGAIVAALGHTEQTLTGTGLGKDFIIKGNVIEAIGNSLQAIGVEKEVQSKGEISEIYTIIGCWLEASGNATTAVGLADERIPEDEGIKLSALGSGVLSLGAAFETLGAVYSKDSLSRSLEIVGNSFIALGALLESIGSVFTLNTKKDIGEKLSLVGSWTQVLGGIILIYAFTFLDN
ncbi:hypothetical protein CWR48_10565 [Oceanobacillus arenosus]|uniref:Uncharacterized protein n=1 Tax=Oceanobacillus arenosus TaxID=1229153 RepID=A0A3D8PSR1_9BACI|nr:hypothetical protein [Oceanobacillus arenosus]RDW18752.1 hypothetical protein CWR48_10565 [Oceanobacillus arenosus]